MGRARKFSEEGVGVSRRGDFRSGRGADAEADADAGVGGK